MSERDTLVLRSKEYPERVRQLRRIRKREGILKLVMASNTKDKNDFKKWATEEMGFSSGVTILSPEAGLRAVIYFHTVTIAEELMKKLLGWAWERVRATKEVTDFEATLENIKELNQQYDSSGRKYVSDERLALLIQSREVRARIEPLNLEFPDLVLEEILILDEEFAVSSP